MNLETLDLLSTKVEKALETIRHLKAEKNRLDEQVASLGETNKRLRAELDEKDQALALVSADLDRRNAELQMLHDTVQDRDVKIQIAAERLEHVMNTLETELGTSLNISLDAAPSSTISDMSAEEAASLFEPAPESEESAAVSKEQKEEQASFFDYGGTGNL